MPAVDPKELADLIATAIKTAVSPLLDRVRAVERDLESTRTQMQQRRMLARDGRDGIPGMKGEPGDRGPQGEPGATGAPGVDGTSMLAGYGPPVGVGQSDDVYLDAGTGDVYVCR